MFRHMRGSLIHTTLLVHTTPLVPPRKNEWMPDTGEGIARRLFDAFNRRDIETALGLLHPDVVFEPVSGAILNDGQPYRGHEGMRRYFADVQEHWHELHVTPVHTRAAGDAVVALGQTSGRGPAGPLDGAPTTWVFKFKDDLAAHIQVFSDERLARKALAVEEPSQSSDDTETA
jgi:ketosteroid isomerase-like protein